MLRSSKEEESFVLSIVSQLRGPCISAGLCFDVVHHKINFNVEFKMVTIRVFNTVCVKCVNHYENFHKVARFNCIEKILFVTRVRLW